MPFFVAAVNIYMPEHSSTAPTLPTVLPPRTQTVRVRTLVSSARRSGRRDDALATCLHGWCLWWPHALSVVHRYGRTRPPAPSAPTQQFAASRWATVSRCARPPQRRRTIALRRRGAADQHRTLPIGAPLEDQRAEPCRERQRIARSGQGSSIEVFRLGSARTPILGRTRPSPCRRRVGTTPSIGRASNHF